MPEVLYRKYRSQTLTEIVGQMHITKTLARALITKRIAHAYFLAGPKGTGKTSTARIIAKAVNCIGKKNTGEAAAEPCNECDMCKAITDGRALDLIEIDAASNRGIDEIRSLKEKVHFPPVAAQYKVYIIDEVHMLTQEANNALLKTLEEPPAHVIFILCTTEPHKVPETIISRCQRFDFKRATVTDIIALLQQVAQKEGLAINRQALQLIAQNASGGFRDAVGLLDQVASFSKKGEEISPDIIQKSLGLTDVTAISHLIDLLCRKNIKEGLLFLNHLSEEGLDAHQFVKSILEYLRKILLIRNGVGEDFIESTKEQYQRMEQQAKDFDYELLMNAIFKFSQAEKDIKTAFLPQFPFELAFIELLSEKDNRPSSVKTPVAPMPKNPEKGNNIPSKDRNVDLPVVSKDDDPDEKNSSGVDETILLDEVLQKWPKFLEAIKPYNHSVEAFLRSCRPVSVNTGTITLEFFYPFHKEKIESAKNRELVEKVLEQSLGKRARILCTLSDRQKKASIAKEHGNSQTQKEHNLVQAAQEIFNGEMMGPH